MLNVLTKTKLWMFASLIAATSVFGQNYQDQSSNSPPPRQCPPRPCPKPCPQPMPPTQMCPGEPKACCPAWPTPVLNAAYNYPARIQTRCPWDFFVDASFIYWQPLQENMEVGFSNKTLVSAGIDGHFIDMNTYFKPGFKVGLGGFFDYDNWDLRLEYTWFHQSEHRREDALTGGEIVITNGHPADYLSVGGGPFDSVHGHWNLKMDIVQLDLGRWHYVGTKFTAHPYFGPRVALIRQKRATHYSGTSGTDDSKERTRSWAVGPEAGLDTNWNMGWGFRLIGNAEADILFTRYNHLHFNREITATTGIASAPIHTHQKHLNTVRTHLDLELGFGWGMYLDCHNWYIDFALTYGFQAFFDQNMFRHFVDDVMIMDSLLPNGNLYINGLTATFKLDF